MAGAVVAAAMMATAGSAVAAVWSPAGPAVAQGTVTATQGAQSTTCTGFRLNGTIAPTGSAFHGTGQLFTVVNSCDNGGSMSMGLLLTPGGSAGVYYVSSPYGPTHASPFGGVYAQESFTAPFQNPIGGTPGRIVLSNTTIGRNSSGVALKLTGNLDMTTTSGGLVSIN